MSNQEHYERFIGIERETPQISILCYDMDGTLIDSMSKIPEIFATHLEDDFGVPYPEALKFFMDTHGTPTSQQLISLFGGEYGFRITEEEARAFGGIIDHRIANIDAKKFPDIDQMLATFKSEGKRMFISTSHTSVAAIKRLDEFGIGHNFDFVLGKTDDDPYFTKGKPHFEEAASRYGMTYADFIRVTVAMSDGKHDIRQFVNAGVTAIGREGTYTREILMNEGALLTLPDFTRLPDIIAYL
jgi:phosphoglycolate phosphatase-like HAD superfamily hydrolase